MLAEIRSQRWFLIVGSVITFATAAVVFMWFDTTPPFEYDVKESQIVPQVAEGGMQIRVDWKVKVNRVCPGTNVRELFDPVTKSRLAFYDPVPTASDSAIDDDGHLIRTFLLPRRISKGPVGYRAHLSYQCNWLQRFFPLELETPELFFELVDHND